MVSGGLVYPKQPDSRSSLQTLTGPVWKQTKLSRSFLICLHPKVLHKSLKVLTSSVLVMSEMLIRHFQVFRIRLAERLPKTLSRLTWKTVRELLVKRKPKETGLVLVQSLSSSDLTENREVKADSDGGGEERFRGRMRICEGIETETSS